MERNKLVIGKRYYLGSGDDAPVGLYDGLKDGSFMFIDIQGDLKGKFLSHADGRYGFLGNVSHLIYPVEEEVKIQDTKPPLESKKGWFSKLLNYLNL